MKMLLITIMLMLFSSSLSAYTSSDMFLFIGGGKGLSYGEGVIYNDNLGEYALGDFKSVEQEKSHTWNAGLSGEIFMLDDLALTLGVIKEEIKIKIVVHDDNPINDEAYLFDFKFITFPVGLHYYFDPFFLGGGMYYSIIQDQSLKIEGYSEPLVSDLAHDDYGFFIDTGINMSLTEKVNIIVFGRYKRGYTETYEYFQRIVNVGNLRTLTLNAAIEIKF